MVTALKASGEGDQEGHFAGEWARTVRGASAAHCLNYLPNHRIGSTLLQIEPIEIGGNSFTTFDNHICD